MTKIKIKTSSTLPVLSTLGLITFPKFTISLEVGREESIKAIEISQKEYQGMIVLVSQIDFEKSDIVLENLYNIGVLCKISKVELDENKKISTISLLGIKRVRLIENKFSNGTIFSRTSEFEDFFENPQKASELQDNLINQFKAIVSKLQINITIEQIEPFIKSPIVELIDAFAYHMPLPNKVKIQLLIEANVEKRVEIITANLAKLQINPSTTTQTNNKKNVIEDINSKVRTKLNEQQREFYLREQLKTIKEELDEIGGSEGENEGFLKRLNSNPYPSYIKDKVKQEVKRLENTPASSAEANVIRTYIEWLLDLPYWQKAEEKVDIKKAKKILDQHHYGLEKVKERIIEYLAVKEKNPNSKGTIICLIGAPGTGKTSLAKSIAESLSRKMIKISLGGVRDEAEIRGHRRTYIASMPGKIIQSMKKAGIINPVILLDEIDKMSADYKGDPTSAMLEVLDYEQNKTFQDHFIEEEYDLSNVMFIATANYYDHIPKVLLDRLEIIEVSSYTELEKLEIAKTHLIPKIIEETKVPTNYFEFSNEILIFLIRHYTLEAGVRQINRVLESLARKILVLELNKKIKKNFIIDEELIVKLLGKWMFDFNLKEKKPQVGVATGLAWTAYGGDILPIEVTLYPGKGDVILTGSLKEVMKESATIALSYVKANAKKFGIIETIQNINSKDPNAIGNIFKLNDFHIHVPEGATPKDGPSAGVTFTTAIISALTKKTISPFYGMTGEITLRGNILPIGGLKEKSISALRSGLKEIFIPIKNDKDLVDLPKEVKNNLKITLVEKYDDLFNHIFE